LRQGVIEFFHLWCGEVTNHYFGKLPNSRMALWITIEFKKASSLAKALEYNSTLPPITCPAPPCASTDQWPSLGADCKSFNRKTISISKAKTDKEREADLKRQSSTEARQAARAAAKQARQQCAVDKTLNNMVAMGEYSQNALLHACNFASSL
jgi:hypothetical protein